MIKYPQTVWEGTPSLTVQVSSGITQIPPASRWGNIHGLWPTGPCTRSVLLNRLSSVNNDYLIFLFYLFIHVVFYH